MRLKTYTAATTAEAMNLVRQDMGDEAIIVSTQRAARGSGARVTAALELIGTNVAALATEQDNEKHDVAKTIRQALNYHGTPARLGERLVDTATALGMDDPMAAFAGALEAGFEFAPIPEIGEDVPVILVGPPGAGKTVTVAKLAARAILAGRCAGLITTDTQRAGGIEQLAAFTRILNIELKTAHATADLRRAVAERLIGTGPLYIDTPGTNPFSDSEMDHLGGLIVEAKAEPVLVLPAGGDAMEAADIASSFADIGATRLLVTRLDMVRRVGSILAAADAARLKFCDVSITPYVADGLSPINALSLARLIMPHSAETSFRTEASS
jgi:flagellar biosynthesis protein FlhF